MRSGWAIETGQPIGWHRYPSTGCHVMDDATEDIAV
jgi:hypothetical protein